MVKILVIDDDRFIRRTLELHLKSDSVDVLTSENMESGRRVWQKENPDIIILDMMLPEGMGSDLLAEATRKKFGGLVVIITGSEDMEMATEAMRLGAFDYLVKPLDMDQLDLVMERAIGSAKKIPEPVVNVNEGEEFKPGKIVGKSRSVLELHKQIGLAARCFANVFIQGETGTGKELVARSIHRSSHCTGDFVAVNCSAIVPTLMESELFGHEKGSFTGAVSSKAGQLEVARDGTIFLDEIGDLPLDLQVKLLRVLQEREFKRVGGAQSIPLIARVITATHRDLKEMVDRGAFREDLYYRLKVMEINIAPLRERREDIAPLVIAFLRKTNSDVHRNVTKIPESILRALENYDWPGNVRELENRITAAVIRSPGEFLEIELPDNENKSSKIQTDWDWNRPMEEVEKFHIQEVLKHVDGHFGKACDVLGISRPTLRKKISDYGLKGTFKE